ncbi:HNH endonuclease [Rheinheimera fenheensis]|uniref:HNH endonuclease n=1 Tax=Rheinheimera fenheensis TaxID=3152295 RepID=UPI003F7E5607
MPRTNKPCRKCKRTLTRDSSGYCEACKPADDTNWSGWQRQRGNRHERGYGSQWQILRAEILERDEHLCQMCIKDGVHTRATHVDHIKPKSQGGTDARTNLQALCKPCHDVKTATERRGGAGQISTA